MKNKLFLKVFQLVTWVLQAVCGCFLLEGGYAPLAELECSLGPYGTREKNEQAAS